MDFFRMEILVPVLAVVAAVLLVVWIRRQSTAQTSRERLFDGSDSQSPERPIVAEESSAGFLRRWLALAGYRSHRAAPTFLWATVASFTIAGVSTFLALRSSLAEQAAIWLEGVPGGLGTAFAPVLVAGPWIVMIVIGLFPFLAVRSARRERVTEVENDLPMTLELLATLAEAGLGFDAALDRVIEAWPLGRHLAGELRAFQVETLAGYSRVECFRRLARRLEVSGVTLFTSAMIQAEQMGSAVATVLRTQATDLRHRRRERAIRMAEALQVKLVFPLVICCLPGLFVITLGPAFAELFEVLEGIIQSNVGGS